MIISRRKEISLAVFADPSWPLFSARAAEAAQKGPVAAYTLAWQGRPSEATSSLGESERELARSLVRGVQRLGLIMQVLLIHQPLQPRSAAVSFRKIWRSVLLPPPPDGVQRGPEVQLDCGDRLRFAALATVPVTAIDWVVAAMDTFEMVVPLLLSRALPDEEAARSLARAAFPPDGCGVESLDWPGLVLCLYDVTGIAVRRTKNLADAEFSADLFGPSADIERLASAMEDGR